MSETRPEPWLRGPVSGIPMLLQPVAHAFIMAREDVAEALAGLEHRQLWLMPGGAASLGYHLGHLSGSTDRLLTYARGEELTTLQRATLTAERLLCETCPEQVRLQETWERTVEQVMDELRNTDITRLTDAREVGRSKLPSTVLGLLFHAAEHASRHTGQIVTTSRIIRGMA